MGDKIKLGVNKASKFLTPDMYDVRAGELVSFVAGLAQLVGLGGEDAPAALPGQDLSVNEDGSTNPDFDAAAAYALESIEVLADQVKTKAAQLRSLVNNRPKIAQGPMKADDLDDQDEEEDDAEADNLAE